MAFVLKLNRPVQDKEKFIYISEISFSSIFTIQSPVLKESLAEVEENLKEKIIPILLTETKSWFSKPIQEKYLRDRLFLTIPLESLPAQDFEGTSTWRFYRLEISKERFTIIAQLQDVKEVEKICLEDDEDEMDEIEEFPFTQAGNEPIGIGPTRRQLLKEKVMRERSKAAKALFRAERLTQDYYAKYGDTDWEDSDDDLSDEDSE
jgi:hypothetical protein